MSWPRKGVKVRAREARDAADRLRAMAQEGQKLCERRAEELQADIQRLEAKAKRLIESVLKEPLKAGSAERLAEWDRTFMSGALGWSQARSQARELRALLRAEVESKLKEAREAEPLKKAAEKRLVETQAELQERKKRSIEARDQRSQARESLAQARHELAWLAQRGVGSMEEAARRFQAGRISRALGLKSAKELRVWESIRSRMPDIFERESAHELARRKLDRAERELQEAQAAEAQERRAIEKLEQAASRAEQAQRRARQPLDWESDQPSEELKASAIGLAVEAAEEISKRRAKAGDAVGASMWGRAAEQKEKAAVLELIEPKLLKEAGSFKKLAESMRGISEKMSQLARRSSSAQAKLSFDMQELAGQVEKRLNWLRSDQASQQSAAIESMRWERPELSAKEWESARQKAQSMFGKGSRPERALASAASSGGSSTDQGFDAAWLWWTLMEHQPIESVYSGMSPEATSDPSPQEQAAVNWGALGFDAGSIGSASSFDAGSSGSDWGGGGSFDAGSSSSGWDVSSSCASSSSSSSYSSSSSCSSSSSSCSSSSSSCSSGP